MASSSTVANGRGDYIRQPAEIQDYDHGTYGEFLFKDGLKGDGLLGPEDWLGWLARVSCALVNVGVGTCKVL